MTSPPDPTGEVEAHSALRGALSAIVLPDCDDELLADLLHQAVRHCEATNARLREVLEANSLDASLRNGIDAVLSAEAATAALVVLITRLGEMRAASAAATREARAVLAEAMTASGTERAQTRFHVAAPLDPTPHVEIADAPALPAEFWRQPEPVPDKAALLFALRGGRDIPGARLAVGRASLRISARKDAK